MSEKSTDKEKIVRYTADNLPKRSPKRLEELRRLMERPDDEIDTTDMPEVDLTDPKWITPAKRHQARLRTAIDAEMKRRGMTRYQLAKVARRYCSSLPESAVYEYLAGQRQVGADYIEAMLAALELEVVPKTKSA